MIILIIQHLTLQKLGNIEDNSEDRDGEGVLEESETMRGDILDDLVVVVRLVDRQEPLHSDSHRGEDGSSHGDVVHREEKHRKQFNVEICFITQCSK